MRRQPFLPAAAVLLLFSAPARAQDIAYEKFALQNGMTVILHEDHSLPQVVINTWFRVGSKDEQRGRSGFAHLFEHLMFMGTERVPGSEFDNLMEAGGGSNNASTTEDRTNYFSEGPASLLPTLLWLDADRLEDLGRTMTQEKLDRQRDVVRNEIRQNVENTPYGRAEELIFRLMFPIGHPYHEAVYGTHEDLEAATVDNVKDFFANFYVPNNASLVVAGDFDAKATKQLVENLFGTLPRGAEITRRDPGPTMLDHVVRTTMLDRVQLPLLKMVWHSPRAYAAGDAEMIQLGSVLAEGQSSRLYKRLVFDDKLAVDVSAYQDSLSLGSMFSIDVTAAPGADLDAIERIVDEELQRLQKDGIQPKELEQRKAASELRRLARLQSIGSMADLMNQYEFVWGEPNSFARDLERFRTTTPTRVQAAATQYLQLDRRAILRVLPEQPERTASARDTRPADGADSAFTPVQPDTFQLRNGITVHLWHKPELPLVSMRVQFQNGSVLTAEQPAGLLALTTSMMEEGAGDLDALAFGDSMRGLGASFGIGSDHETATASLTVLRRNFRDAASLLVTALRKPRFEAQDWERVKRLHLEGLRQAEDEPTSVASLVAMRTLFGDNNPYGRSTGGTLESVEPLQLDDIRREHARVFQASNAIILIAGDITAENARDELQRVLTDWKSTGQAEALPHDYAAPTTNGLRVVLVDRPDAVQTVVHFVAPGPHYRDPQRMQFQLINTLLGGSFTSRLNQNLREQHGYTYGAGSGYAMSPAAGYFTASASVRSDVTGASLQEFMNELKRLAGSAKGDVTDAETDKARRTLRAGTVQSFAGLGGVLGTGSELVLNGLPFDSTAADLAALRNATTADLNALCKRALQLDRGVLVLVGDRRVVMPQLEGLGLPTLVEVDVHGDPVRR